MRALIDLWPEHRNIYIEELALVPVVLCRPSLGKYLLGLDEPALCFGEWDAVAAVFVEVIGSAASDAQYDSPPADVVEEGYLLREPDWVVERHLDGGEAYLDALSAGRDRGGECDGVNVGAGAIVMVLAEPDSIEAELLSEFGLAERVGHDLVVGVGRIGLWK